MLGRTNSGSKGSKKGSSFYECSVTENLITKDPVYFIKEGVVNSDIVTSSDPNATSSSGYTSYHPTYTNYSSYAHFYTSSDVYNLECDNYVFNLKFSLSNFSTTIGASNISVSPSGVSGYYFIEHDDLINLTNNTIYDEKVIVPRFTSETEIDKYMTTIQFYNGNRGSNSSVKGYINIYDLSIAEMEEHDLIINNVTSTLSDGDVIHFKLDDESLLKYELPLKINNNLYTYDFINTGHNYLKYDGIHFINMGDIFKIMHNGMDLVPMINAYRSVSASSSTASSIGLSTVGYNVGMSGDYYEIQTTYSSQQYYYQSHSTNNLIDFSKYSKLYITYKGTYNKTTSTAVIGYLKITDKSAKEYWIDSVASLSLTASAENTATLDLSDINGEYYLNIFLAGGTYSDLFIKDIYLE